MRQTIFYPLVLIILILSIIFYKISIPLLCVCCVIFALFMFFKFPYKVCLYFFRGKSIGAGMCHPWKKEVIWLYRDGYKPNDKIIRHENCHLKQINNFGSWQFTFLYIYYTLLYGYKENPLEVEARGVE